MSMDHSNGNGHNTSREDFGGRELATTSERQGSAIVARVTAEIQARSIVALQRPRDIMVARKKLLDAARRPAFAAVARYAKPIGKKKNDETGKWEEAFVEGPSIRFVEEAIRCLGNIATDSMVTEDDRHSRTVRVTVTDLEANIVHATDITIEKTVERRNLKQGQKALSSRANSYGEAVYILEATADEVATKQAAAVSKAVRTLGLRVIPGDIVDEAESLCIETASDETKRDPTRALKNLVDAYGGIGVKPEHLAEFLGHSVADATGDEINDLRAIGNAIKEGHTTWRETMEARRTGDDDKPTPPSGESASDKLKAKLAEKKVSPAQAAAPKSEPAVAKVETKTETAPVAKVETTAGREIGADDNDSPEPPDGALVADKVAPRNQAPAQATIRTLGGRR